jgi:carboxymethylenebutenolidase
MSTIELHAADGHTFSAYEASPSDPPRGGVIIIQEVFGVNRHIRAVADGYAADGYHAIAPALFDRNVRNVELDYTDEGRATGRRVVAGVSFDDAVTDVDAARAALADAGAGPIGIVGFCWGGTVGWRAATHLDGIAALSAYYPGRITDYIAEQPRCPIQFHFAERDHSITPAEIETVRAVQGSHAEIYVYPAAHGFNCDLRPIYDAPSAALARERTLRLLGAHVAAR